MSYDTDDISVMDGIIILLLLMSTMDYMNWFFRC